MSKTPETPDRFLHLKSSMSERDYKALQDMVSHGQTLSAKRKKEQADITHKIKTEIWPNLHSVPNLNQYLNTLDLNEFDVLREYQDEKSGHTLLHLAVIRRDVVAFANLPYRGINQRIQDNNGLTPIQYAVEQVPEFFRSLLADKNDRINFKVANAEGRNALHHAIKIGRFGTASLLCNAADERLPDINARDKDGNTALSLLLKNTYDKSETPEITQLMGHMIANGADPFIKDKDGISLFEIAVKKGFIENPLEYLINYQASSESQQVQIIEQIEKLKDHYEVRSDFYTRVSDTALLKEAISGPNYGTAIYLIDKYFPRDKSERTIKERTDIFKHAQKCGKSSEELEALAAAFDVKLKPRNREKSPSSASDISRISAPKLEESPSPSAPRKRSPSEKSDSTAATEVSTDSEGSRSSKRSGVKLNTSIQFVAKLIEHYGTTFDQGVLDKMRKYAMIKDGILEHTAADTERYEQGKARKSAIKHLAKLLPLRQTDNEMIKQLTAEYQKFEKDNKHQIDFPERWGQKKKKLPTQEH